MVEYNFCTMIFKILLSFIFHGFLQFALNEGAHQLRLYCQGPRDNSPITASCLADAGIRIIPCASLLVRLTRVPRGPTGKALEVTLLDK